MKLNYPKEWFEQRIEKEGAVHIGAGGGGPVRPLATAAGQKARLAFGEFVAFWRRNKGWNAERLATEAGIATQDVLEIEQDPYCEPRLDSVFKLAALFGVPSQALQEMCGLTGNAAPYLREESGHTNWQSESTAALSNAERQALDDLMTTLLTRGEG